MGESSIRDNYKNGTVGEFLTNTIDENSEIAIVSAYFTIYAYHYLKDKLNHIKKMRFLFGEPTFTQPLNQKLPHREYSIEDDQLVIPLENRLEQKKIAKECADWIKEKVEIRSMVKPNFLHGKLYHITQSNGVQHSLVGSSNFTIHGLGAQSKNIELNIVIDSRRDRKDLAQWFDDLWNDKSGLVEDVKDKVLQYLTQLYSENSPQFIYYKTLYHLFADYLKETEEKDLLESTVGFYNTKIWNMLFEFQKDAVKGAINKIEKYNGCIIADSVGLGKTFEALAIIKFYELRNNKVLVLAPKKLKNNWTLYQAYHNNKLNPLIEDKFGYTVLNHTDLSRDSGLSGDIELSKINWGNFDFVVIDESHNFRNNTKGKRDDEDNLIRKSRYEKLMEDIIQSGVNTKVLLLSATPVNNNLKDLRNQIYFITKDKDTALAENIGIRSIEGTIKKAQKNFTQWADPKKMKHPNVTTLLNNLGSDFFALLDGLTIARSRKHIESYYQKELIKIGNFPKREPVLSLSPKISTEPIFPSYEAINEQIMHYKLSLFNPTAYVKEDKKEIYEKLAGTKVTGFKQEERESHLIGMIKVGLLKRLESSIESFRISLKRTLDKIEELEEKIIKFQIQNSQNSQTIDADSFDITDKEKEDDEELLDSFENTIGKKLKFHLQDMNLDVWLQDLKKDKDPLLLLFHSAEKITVEKDNKLKELKRLIKNKVENPINDNNKKVLVFTAFADTARYLYANLKDFVYEKLGLHIALIMGSGENQTTYGKRDYDDILTNFSPKSKNRDKIDPDAKEEIDVLIATDCISEGQNLQDCDYLINYDIHWNPVRIIQRFGRIDRIGSTNKKIQLVNFWPTDDLDQYINLKKRVEARMALVDITATGEDNVLDFNTMTNSIETELKFRDRQLKKLKNEVLDLEDLDDNVSLTDFSLEDYRVDLNSFLTANKEKLENSPLGLYAVVPSPSGAYAESGPYSDMSQTIKEIIQPGIIYCLRKKGDKQESQTVNPLFPYFLVYIRDNQDVLYNFTNAKQILDIYKKLCYGVVSPYEEICALFNKETDNGNNMEKENALLQKAMSEINTIFKKRVNQNLINNRDGIIPRNEQEKMQFELITWLVIK